MNNISEIKATIDLINIDHHNDVTARLTEEVENAQKIYDAIERYIALISEVAVASGVGVERSTDRDDELSEAIKTSVISFVNLAGAKSRLAIHTSL